MIKSEAWVLPRPELSKYKGGFPRYFEKRLLHVLHIDPRWHKILHPFGGKAQFGIRGDINIETEPDYLGDAHVLPFKNNSFDLVIFDPPYSDEYSKRLYNTGKLHFKKYSSEGVRVLKPEGFLIMYHYLATPRIKGVKLYMRIFLETRMWHKLRCIHIHLKRSKVGLGLLDDNY